jgi:hypothetical protein
VGGKPTLPIEPGTLLVAYEEVARENMREGEGDGDGVPRIGKNCVDPRSSLCNIVSPVASGG